ENFRGKHVPYAPGNTLFAAATYSTPLRGIADLITVNINCRGVGPVYWDEDNASCQPFYALLGASLSFVRDWWSVDLWADNITAARYDVFSFVSVSQRFNQRGKPRTCGLTLRINFE
ncbi:MAG: TonB-dependent receptor, partial [Candidatus Amulumruptor sp.]|nr:TonB-dependent receptor [Candidatus Amulumruptor sp.]